LAGAGARPPTGTLPGSAPVPVAVSGVAPKTVFQTIPSAVRRGIFVEIGIKLNFSPVGAASSVRIPDDAAPDGALPVDEWRWYKYVSPDGLGKICVPSLFHLWLKNSNALCPVRPTQTAFGRVFVAGQYF